ncbi:MAG: type II secretion system protein GspK [Planctomycetales bacterium]|nr:type II secretion system protein GspK [Planctomycetales bacterium]
MKMTLPTTRWLPKSGRPAGFALMVALIVLVVLSSLMTGLALHLTMAKRRQQYMIEYQRARYGADSAMKYILTELPQRNFAVQNRVGKPDFSDLYWMNDAEYSQFIANWAMTATVEDVESVLKDGVSLGVSDEMNAENLFSNLMSLFGAGGTSDLPENPAPDANSVETDSGDPNEAFYGGELDPNDIEIPGPYGPSWPYVMEPIELEIGTCRVTIVVEDENAKMPLSWLVTNSSAANKQAENALLTFCEWMARDMQGLGELQETIQTAMDEVYKRKAFKLNPSPIILRPAAAQPQPAKPAGPPQTTAAGRRKAARILTQQGGSQPAPQTAPRERRPVAHTTDFAKLFHSSLLNQEVLARPLPDMGQRQESPLKYLSLWGAQRVNINTAPRHVLEATFTLAIDPLVASELAHAVIEQRKEKPFRSAAELKELGRLDAGTMNTLQNYITTASTFFQVRVTSRSGNARAVAVATVVKEGKQMERLAILYQ